ncbi:hypothetical protein ACJW30_09G052900 [Castanea mollissima]
MSLSTSPFLIIIMVRTAKLYVISVPISGDMRTIPASPCSVTTTDFSHTFSSHDSKLCTPQSFYRSDEIECIFTIAK